MNRERSDTEKISLIEESKKIGINEIIKHNKIINTKILKYKKNSSCYLKCWKNTESINSRISKTNNGKTMILSKCAICGNKRSRFIKKQEISGILTNLGLKTPLNKIPLLGDILL